MTFRVGLWLGMAIMWIAFAVWGITHCWDSTLILLCFSWVVLCMTNAELTHHKQGG